MLFKLVEYHWAEHIDDALLLLGRLDTKTVPLAGGTYLLSQQDDTIQAVVDLRDLELAYISEDGRGIHIGAMTTLQSMVDSPLLKEFAAGILSRAALASSSSRLIRNCATIGGTLGAGAASQADVLTALVALGAEAVARSGSKTEVNLSGGTLERPGLPLSGVVYKGKRERHLSCSSYSLERRPNELIVEVVVPRPGLNYGASLMRIGRTASDVALLNAVALVEIENAVYHRVRLVFGGVNMEPIRLQAVERLLEGQPVTNPVNSQMLQAAVRAGIAEFRPPTDPLVSGAYRRVSGVNLGYRVLEEAVNIALWRSKVSSEGGSE
ncbi:MAG TPA: FAD binding domain-containing protein [Ktedonobacteraceae bacterium]|nr:FAD binding domain-containing protein [Ktedonobacteraceae bacterium]